MIIYLASCYFKPICFYTTIQKFVVSKIFLKEINIFYSERMQLIDEKWLKAFIMLWQI